MKPQRRMTRLQRVVSVVTPGAALVFLLGTASPVGASASSTALSVARYAVATATHDRPAHVVTSADVANAASINTVNTSGLQVLINIGDVYGYTRLVLLFEPKSFANICLTFPDTVGGVATIISCPHQAQGLWNSRAGALAASNRAIAAAAANGKAVSGADVVAAAKIYGVTLRHEPTFRAGQGGKVAFTTLVEMGLDTKFTVNNCVRLPRTAYGLPVEVPC